MIDHKTLTEILDYDPLTGDFKFKKRLSIRRVVGVKAGNIDKQTGYSRIGIMNRLYYAHRLAWFYVYGEWPKHTIDHINGNRDDNRIENLRDVPNAINARNQKARQGNAWQGTSYCKRRQKWIAQVCHEGRNHFLGYHNTREQAYQVASEKRRALGFHENHGRVS